MNINCPQCGAEYEIDGTKIPETGAKVECSKCKTMIDIDFPLDEAPDWYITTDGENVYEASNEEVIEWIQENRLLREHSISKDNTSWSNLEQIPEFLSIFEKKEKKEKALDKELADEPTLENEKKETENEEAPVVKPYKKIDYTDYDDSIIESSDSYKPKKNHFFIWFILFIIMGAGIFALIKPKLVKKIFTQINSKNSIKSEDNYNRAMSLLKNYDIKDKDKILKLFNDSLKDNPNYELSLIGKAIYITYSIYFENLNIEFREKLSKKLEILLKQNNNEIINKILSNNNKKLLKSKEYLKELNSLLTEDYQSKLKGLTTKKNHDIAVIMGLISYFNKNNNALKKYLADATTLNSDSSKTALLKLLHLKTKNDKSYLLILDELTTKYANSIPLKFLSSFELLNQNKFGEAKYSFKGIKGLSPVNQLATEYIMLLNELIKNKDLLVEKKPAENKLDDEKKDDKNKKDNALKDKTPKDKVKKEVSVKSKKPPKKLSASKATEIGWNLIDSNRLSSAIKKFKYAISVNPNYAEAYQGLGEVYRIRKDNENAVRYFKIFLSKDPHNSEAGLVRSQIKKLESDK